MTRTTTLAGRVDASGAGPSGAGSKGGSKTQYAVQSVVSHEPCLCGFAVWGGASWATRHSGSHTNHGLPIAEHLDQYHDLAVPHHAAAHKALTQFEELQKDISGKVKPLGKRYFGSVVPGAGQNNSLPLTLIVSGWIA